MQHLIKPFKLIHKYKNYNDKTSYTMYIFIGWNVPSEVKNILDKIKNMTYNETMKQLNKNDKKIIEDYYGKKWYLYFFSNAHLVKYSDNFENIDLNEISEDSRKNKSEMLRNFNNEEKLTEEDNNINEENNIYDDMSFMDNQSQDIYTDIDMEANIKSNIKDKDRKLKSVYYDNIDNMQKENIYKKIYIDNNYIDINDSIVAIKNKICSSINGSVSRLMSNRIYLWLNINLKNSSRNCNNKSISHTLIYEGKVLNCDIEPNMDLSVYTDPKNNSQEIYQLLNSDKIIFDNLSYKLLYNYKYDIQNNEIYFSDIYSSLKKDIIVNRTFFNSYCKIYYPAIKNIQTLKNIVEHINGQKNQESELIKSFNEKNDKKTNRENLIDKNIFKIIDNNFNHLNFIDTDTIYLDTVINTFLSYCNNNGINEIDFYGIFNNFKVNKKIPYITIKGLTEPQKILKDFKNYNLIREWIVEENTNYLIAKIKTRFGNYVTLKLDEYGDVKITANWDEGDQINYPRLIQTYLDINKFFTTIKKNKSKMYDIKVPSIKQYHLSYIKSLNKIIFDDEFNYKDLEDIFKLFPKYFTIIKGSKDRPNRIRIKYKLSDNYSNVDKIKKIFKEIYSNYLFDENEFLNNFSYKYNISYNILERIVSIIKNENKEIMLISNKKRLDKIPEYKLDDITIDIYGDSEKKLLIKGSKDICQIEYIMELISIIVKFYYQIYQQKNKKFIEIKNDLETNLGDVWRKNVIILKNFRDTVNKKLSNLKSIKQIDKKYGKILLGKRKYSSLCQTKRVPDVVTENNIKKLKDQGYKYNKESGYYEKKEDGNVLRAIEQNNKNIGKKIYYTCSSSKNGIYKYIGYLAKGRLDNKCIPCCFKTDQLNSTNPIKKNFFKKCSGKKYNKKEIENKRDNYRIYITSKIKSLLYGKYSYLPKNIDIYLNIMQNRKLETKKGYFYSSEDGYFLAYGTNIKNYPFLRCVISSFNYDLKNVLENICQKLDDQLFNVINNGKLKLKYGNKNNFINKLRNLQDQDDDYQLLQELICYPKFILSDGIKLFIFDYDNEGKFYQPKVFEPYKHKNTIGIVIIRKVYNKKISNIESKKIKNYNTIHLLRGNFKDYEIFKQFDKEFIDPLSDVFKEKEIMKPKNKLIFTSIHKFEYLKQIFNIDYIVLNKANKIKYVIISKKNKKSSYDGLILPIFLVDPQYGFKQLKTDNLKKHLETFEKTQKMIQSFNKEHNNSIDIIGYYYKSKEKSKYQVNGILLDNKMNIPIKPEFINKIKNKKFEPQPLDVVFDQNMIADNEDDLRSLSIKKDNYQDFIYQIFKYEFYLYLRKNKKYKEEVINLRNNQNYKELKNYILNQIAKNIIDNKTLNKNIKINDIVKEIKNHDIPNTIFDCSTKNKDECQNLSYCVWNNKCSLKVVSKKLLNYCIERLIDDLSIDKTFKEIVSEENYFMDSYIDLYRYYNRDNEILIDKQMYKYQEEIKRIFNFELSETNTRKKLLETQYNNTIIQNHYNIFEAFSHSWYYNETKVILNTKSKLLNKLGKLYKGKIIQLMVKDKISNKKILNYYKSNGLNKDFMETSLKYFNKLSPFKVEIINDIKKIKNKNNINILFYKDNYKSVIYDNKK